MDHHHQRWSWNVRFGSLTDIEVPRPDVRLTPKADIAESDWHVRFVPIADIRALNRDAEVLPKWSLDPT